MPARRKVQVQYRCAAWVIFVKIHLPERRSKKIIPRLERYKKNHSTIASGARKHEKSHPARDLFCPLLRAQKLVKAPSRRDGDARHTGAPRCEAAAYALLGHAV